MIGYIKGKVYETSENLVLLENGNIGYELTVSNTALVKIAENPLDVKLYTYLSVREDGVSFYGFYSREEKNMFMRLISISGVGPKAAIGVLSGIELNDLIVAIISSDIKTLSKIKGIGKKTAERIILELRESLDYTPAETTALSSSGSIATSSISTDEEDAINALKGLGITQSEATMAVKKASERARSIEELIALALKNLN